MPKLISFPHTVLSPITPKSKPVLVSPTTPASRSTPPHFIDMANRNGNPANTVSMHKKEWGGCSAPQPLGLNWHPINTYNYYSASDSVHSVL